MVVVVVAGVAVWGWRGVSCTLATLCSTWGGVAGERLGWGGVGGPCLFGGTPVQQGVLYMIYTRDCIHVM